MKTKLLSFLKTVFIVIIYTSLTSQSRAQTTAIPDVNFEQALIDLGYDTGSPDGSVPTANISVVLGLDVSSKNISDLTGIEDFVSLVEFHCDENELGTIDVSKNTALLELHTNDNPLTTNLDVSKNTALRYLYCYDNQLTSLDLTQNPGLLFLYCYNNDLTTLDLDNNRALKYLYFGSNGNLSSLGSLGLTQMLDLIRVNCNNNNLSSLDVTQNTLLEDLSYSNNNFTTSVDVTQNSNLIQLGCAKNQLTEVDVTQNTKLETLACYDNKIEEINTSNNPALKRLSTYINPLTTDLDVSQNPDLIHLWCYGNQLTSLDITKNPAIIRLQFGDTSLLNADLRNGNNTNIPTADYNSGTTPNLTCIFVDDAAWSTTNWTNVYSGSTFVNDQIGCDALTIATTYVPDDNFEQALIDLGYDTAPLDDYVPTENINTITSLDIINKNIADLTGIEDFVALENLYCTNNNLSSLNVTQNTNLIQLACGGNQLTEIDVTQNTKLETLACYDNSIEEINTSNNPALKRLSTYINPLTIDLDVSQNPDLIHLWCYGNQLTSIDITQNPAIIRLQFGDTSLLNVDLRNGNNTNIPTADYNSGTTPNLTCIFVDDAAWSTTNWTNVYSGSTFVNDQAGCNLLATDIFEQTAFNIYPNPVKDQLTINANNLIIDEVAVFDHTGRMVKNIIWNGNSASFNDLSTGMYILRIKTDQGSTTRKLMKQ